MASISTALGRVEIDGLTAVERAVKASPSQDKVVRIRLILADSFQRLFEVTGTLSELAALLDVSLEEITHFAKQRELIE